MKIPLHGPRPHGPAGSGPLPLTGAHGIQDPIQMIMQTIDRLGRARCVVAVIGGREVRPVVSQLARPRGHGAVEGGLGPLRQAAQAWRELPFGRGLIDVPGSIQHLAAQRPPAALGELKDGGQEAEHPRAGGKELAPRWAGRSKAIRARRADLVIRKDRLGFGDTRAVSCLPALGGGRRGHPDPQHAIAAAGGRHHDFFSVQPRDLLVGHHILGPLRLRRDRRTDQSRAPETAPRPIPTPRIAPKDIRQGRERHAPLPPDERFLYLLGAGNEIGHDKGGPQDEDPLGGLELDAPPHPLLFARLIAVREGIPFPQRLRKQFRVLRVQGR